MNLLLFSTMQRIFLIFFLVIGGCIIVLLLSFCDQKKIPLIEQHCGKCHSATIVYQTRRTEEGWRRVMHGMKIRGMVITEEEEEQVYEILFRNFLLQ